MIQQRAVDAFEMNVSIKQMTQIRANEGTKQNIIFQQIASETMADGAFNRSLLPITNRPNNQRSTYVTYTGKAAESKRRQTPIQWEQFRPMEGGGGTYACVRT